MGLISKFIATGIDAKDSKEERKCMELLSHYGSFVHTRFFDTVPYLHSTGSGLGKFFTIEPNKAIGYEQRPDKYIYSSATVGGITTGGVSKIEGGYDEKLIDATGYHLGYGNFLGMIGGKSKRVKYICLSKELYEKARQSYISKWVRENIYDDAEGRYYINAEQLDYNSCKLIYDWLKIAH